MEDLKEVYKLDRQSKLPLYEQIQQNIRDLIIQGYFKEGDSVPPEFDLAETYGVSRLTVRRALDDLVRQNWLSRRHGVGTFVSKPTRITPIAPYKLSFTDQMLGIGRKPSSKLISSRVLAASDYLAEFFRLREGDSLIETIRIRQADNIPVLLEKSYLSYQRFPEVANPDLWANASLFKFLLDHYSVVISEMDQTLKPVLLSEDDARALDVAAGIPAIQSEIVAISREGEPIEYCWSVSSGDKSEFFYRFRYGEVTI